MLRRVETRGVGGRVRGGGEGGWQLPSGRCGWPSFAGGALDATPPPPPALLGRMWPRCEIFRKPESDVHGCMRERERCMHACVNAQPASVGFSEV
eukprot:366289-Chlamydomonas_euryale.AAC.2